MFTLSDITIEIRHIIVAKDKGGLLRIYGCNHEWFGTEDSKFELKRSQTLLKSPYTVY